MTPISREAKMTRFVEWRTLREIYNLDTLGESTRREVQHFYKCRQCDAWVDKRDLEQVFKHEMTLHETPTSKPH
jgi:hypothetical protein